MKRYRMPVACVILVIMAVCICLVWHDQTYLITRLLISRLELEDFSGALHPNITPLNQPELDVHTILRGVTDKQVQSLYLASCRRMVAIHGKFPVKTYYNKDMEGYPAIATLVDMGDRYLVAGYYHGNDSHGFYMHLQYGTPFDTKSGKLMGGTEIPETMLK